MKRGFVIHHNGPKTNLLGQPHTKCISYWTGVRRYHMEVKGWSDIAYSFGICPHGTRFDGCGWFKNQFANGSDQVGVFDGKDSEWYTVLVFIGYDTVTGVEEIPPPAMTEGVKEVIQEGRDRGLCGMRVLPHNRFKVKRCPGNIYTALANAWDGQPFPPASTQPKEYDEMATKAEIKAALEEVVRDMTTDEPGTAKGYVLGQMVKRLTRELESPTSGFRQALVQALHEDTAPPE